MRTIILFVVLSTSTENARATVIGDAALLVQVAANTGTTVSHTLDILNVAKETGEKIDYYNTLAVHQLYKYRRVEQHVRDMAKIIAMKPKNLRELNRELARLKANLQGLADTIDSVAKDIWNVNDFTDRYWEKMTNSRKDEKEINALELLSASAGPSKKHVQNTAVNTAITGKVLNKMRRDNLEYQRIDLEMKRSGAVRELRRQQFYKEWMR